MKNFSHMTYNDRLRLDTLIRAGHKPKEIAEILHKHVSTIYRELKRGRYIHTNSDLTEEERYNPDEADRKARENLKEKGAGLKIGNDIKLANYLENWFRKKSIPRTLHWQKRGNIRTSFQR